MIDVANNAQVKGKQIAGTRVATSSPVTVATTDYTVITDLTVAGAVAVTLPTGVNGQVIAIVDGKGDAGTNNITISGDGENISGAASFVIDIDRGFAVFQFSTTEGEWQVIAQRKALVNADIKSSAAIAYSKLDLADSIVDADINSAAAIAYSKLNLTGSVNLSTDTAATALPIAKGGTGQTAKTAAFNALAPGSAKGDLAVFDGTDWVRLAVGADGTVPTANSAEASGFEYTAPLVNPMTAAGDSITGGVGGAATALPLGAANTVLKSNGTAQVYGQVTSADCDATVVKTTGAQTIAGAKTFSDAMVVTPSSGVSFNVTDGSGGSSILSVDATNERVGIANASPSYRLDITETGATATGLNIAPTNASYTGIGFRIQATRASTTSYDFARFSANGATVFNFPGSGAGQQVGGGSWANTSDERVKKDITDFTDGLEAVIASRPVKFKYNGKGGMPEDGEEYVGFVAQEIEQIAPYMVTTQKAFLNPSDKEETDIKILNSSALVYMLVNAVKELKSEIETLKKAQKKK